MKTVRLWRAGLTAILIIANLSACSSAPEKTTLYPWKFVTVVGDSTLYVTYLGSPCQVFQSAKAIETSSTVKIVVYEKGDSGGGSCQAAGVLRSANVKLAEPLSHRQLMGCDKPPCLPTSTPR